MSAKTLHTATIFSKASILVVILLMLALPSYAQNTKGDRPEAGPKGAKRENRFRLPFKKKNKQSKIPSFNRGRARGVTRAGTARQPSRSAKPKIYPQSRRYVNNTSSSSAERAGKAVPGTRVRVRSNTAKSRNVYPQYGRYAPRAPRTTQQAVSNRSTLARLNRLQGGPDNGPPGKKKKIKPRSASRSFIARKSINVYANFPRPKKKGEQAVTRDLAGRRLRLKNFETPRPKRVHAPTFQPYYGRKKTGDRPYKGPAAGSHRSATRTTPRAWVGDIAGRKIRGKNYSSRPSVNVGQPVTRLRNTKIRKDTPYRGTLPGGGYKSATQPGEKRVGQRLPGRAPGIGANGIGNFKGNIKGRRPLKGGGSVSGRVWNNNQTPVPVRQPGGNAAKVAGFPGKLRRFEASPGFGNQGEEFTGTLKGRRPLKGGGSVSGKLWNNRETALPVRTPPAGAARAGQFSGNIKAKRPLKGGGSVSGKLWNNNESPIPVRTPPAGAEKVGGFPGKVKRFEQSPGFSDQGEEFTGHIKRPRFWKDYVKNPSAAEDAIKKKRPTDATYQVGELQIRVKQATYARKPKAAPDALRGIGPSKESARAAEYARGIKRNWDYVRNPSSSQEAQRTREPGKAFGRSTDYQGNIKMQKFALFEKNRGLHPDAQFVKINKNNVDGERDVLTNFKLWWARLFKKQETQPDHLKEKGKKPRYDNGEEGLWYD
ncbi:MAG TPA: hypothetical protein VD816_06670 [Ohtaekwangia sp.]|nr:hypothetical protein [Ohtaekwangia sp.]